MPFKSINDLPKAVKDNLPLGAQKIWMGAFNSAFEKYGDDSRAAEIAWGAVKKIFRKTANGWVKRSFSVSVNRKFVVEQNFNGERLFIHKKGNIVMVFSREEDNLTASFPEIVMNARELSDKDFIVDGKLSRDGIFHASDLLYFGETIAHLPWEYRKKALKRLKFNALIKEVGTLIAKDSEEVKEAMKFISKLKHTTGAVIKDNSAPYIGGVILNAKRETKKRPETVPEGQTMGKKVNEELRKSA